MSSFGSFTSLSSPIVGPLRILISHGKLSLHVRGASRTCSPHCQSSHRNWACRRPLFSPCRRKSDCHRNCFLNGNCCGGKRKIVFKHIDSCSKIVSFEKNCLFQLLLKTSLLVRQKLWKSNCSLLMQKTKLWHPLSPSPSKSTYCQSSEWYSRYCIHIGLWYHGVNYGCMYCTRIALVDVDVKLFAC